MLEKNFEMSFNAGSASAHIGGALSSSDIIQNFFWFLKYDKIKQPGRRDRFILSKGHACLAYYGFKSDWCFVW